MINSPFIYGSTVSNQAFTDREAETKKLKSNLTGGINTIIISPRRWGKSSLVEKVAEEIRSSDLPIKVAIIDLFMTGNQPEFLESFARQVIKATSTKWEDWVRNAKSLFRQIIPKIQISADPGNEFSLSFDWDELKKFSDEILELPETIAKEKNIRIIICIDEFQNLAHFPEFLTLEKKMRAIWQRHKSATYCIYGSKRHMMTNIFNNPSKPFYRFGDLILLQKIQEENWIPFICDGFVNSGKQINTENAKLIANLMQNHPWYIQQLAHYTWNLTQEKATKTEIQSALTELINANGPLYQSEVENLSQTLFNLLKAVAAGETQFSANRVMQNFNLGTPRNAMKNKAILINNDIIQQAEGHFEFIDPAFEIWFRLNFMNKPLSKYFD